MSFEAPPTIEDCKPEIDQLRKDFSPFVKHAYPAGEDWSGVSLVITLENRQPQANHLIDVTEAPGKILLY